MSSFFPTQITKKSRYNDLKNIFLKGLEPVVFLFSMLKTTKLQLIKVIFVRFLIWAKVLQLQNK